MGYTKDEDGNLIIVPEEAEIIKRIYPEYLEGQSLVGIGPGLEKDGILTAAGKPRWRPESVKEDTSKRKIHRRCPSAKDCHSRFSDQETS